MTTSTVQAAKLAVVAATGLAKDALHIYVGLAVFLLVLALWPGSRRTWRPLLIVLLVAVGGELLDLRDDLASLGYWRWSASLHDVLNTAFWPAVLSGLMRWTSLFASPRR